MLHHMIEPLTEGCDLLTTYVCDDSNEGFKPVVMVDVGVRHIHCM